MEITLNSPTLSGSIKAISSKSMAHRSLICAAFGNQPCKILCENTNNDITATADCLCALGADIKRNESTYSVTPIKAPLDKAVLDCKESGSTLRFLLPIVGALGVSTQFVMHGRLSERPLSPLYEELVSHGMSMSPQGTNPLKVSGALNCGNYSIAAHVSSQFVSGLMFALPLIGSYNSCSTREKCTLTLTGSIESAPYIKMTKDALKSFGIALSQPYLNENKETTYIFDKNIKFTSPKTLSVEGDWSNAAFWLCSGAIGKAPITVSGLNLSSSQGDMDILRLLERFGANVQREGDSVTVTGGTLHGIDIDASQIPDLVPILAVVASVSRGKTVIGGAARLRIKESDRLTTTTEMLRSLGADIKETEDGLIINGKNELLGGTVSSANDHRIAMASAIASTVCKNKVVICGAEAVSKSYPDFFEHFNKLSKG